MILVDGEKYACVQCIRGHRSSTCKHTLRPLVQVRSRGRPSLNAGHRIAVTESELVVTKDQVILQADLDAAKEDGVQPAEKKPVSSCCAKKKQAAVKEVPKSCSCKNKSSSCSCNGDSVIILKASKRQYVDVNDGKLDFVGDCHNDQAMKKFRVGLGRASSIRHTPGAACQSMMMHSALQPLKTLKVKAPALNNNFVYIEPRPLPNDSIVPLLPNIGLSYPHQQRPPLQPQQQHLPVALPIIDERFYDMFRSEGCASECHCGPECSCPGCLIHRTNEELEAYGLLDPSSTASTPSTKQDLPDTANTDIPASLINFQTMTELDFEGLLEASCICSDDCSCYNCVKHGIINGVRQSEQGLASTNASPMESASIEPAPILPSQASIDAFYNAIEAHDCGCAPDECECFNCLKHGRVNGVKIS